MTFKFMLDSGAYTAWTAGAEIDCDAYGLFCMTEGQGASYYVNLDVLTGNMRSTEEVEKACIQSCENYDNLCDYIPEEKVLPVYHLQDPIKWLHKYLDQGCKYIALGGIAKTSKKNRMHCLTRIWKEVENVKVHGFGIASFDVMTEFPWYSLDASSWKYQANWGNFYLPHLKQGGFDYSKPPIIVGVSPMSKTKEKYQAHYTSMSPLAKERVDDYLKAIDLEMGSSIIMDVGPGYKLAKGECFDLWYDKSKNIILHPLLKGVSNSFEERCKANVHFVRQMNKALPVKHIYFAGNPLPYELEFQMGRRLLSYFYVLKYKRYGARVLQRHLKETRDHAYNKKQ